MQTEEVLRVEGLSKRFGTRTAVDRLSFALRRGELVGLLGPNGAGKTTTIGMIAGLVQPTEGTIRLFGHDPQQVAAVRRRVGLMPETASFYPYLDARQNLRVMAKVYGVDDSQIETLLTTVGLSEHAGRKFRTYSQGMRQMLSLASALLGDPDLLLLDEPTNGLDPYGQQRVHELLRSLAAQGRTILLSSHLLRDVEQLCSRVIIINRGQLVADAPVSHLLQPGIVDVLVRTTDDHRAFVLVNGPSRPAWITQVERRDGHLLIRVASEHVPELSALLVTNGLYLHEFRPVHSDLMTVFVELTSGSDARSGDA